MTASPDRAGLLRDEDVARLFHDAYERLAPDFGYRTREASAKPWDDVPEQNRALMTATVHEVRDALATGDSEGSGLDVLIEDGRKWQAAEAEGHVVTFSEAGYGLMHPPSCRPDLIGCDYNEYLAARYEPDEEPGRYRMTLVTTGHGVAAEYARLTSGDAPVPDR